MKGMRSSILLTVCLLSHGTTKSWSLAPQLAQKKNVENPSSTALDLFRRSRLKSRSVAERSGACENRRGGRFSRRREKEKGAAEMLRSVVLTNADGIPVQLGDKMGERTVIVFLRHMGCCYSWSYAREWSKLQRKIARSGAVGPLFVSVGDCGKLQTFLQLNRNIPRKQAFVDDSSLLQAYESIGLGSMEFGKSVDSDVAAPKLGGVRGWWKYMRSVEELTPVEVGSRKFAEGVKQLGGTFIIDGDEVIYEWNDRFPGDTPVPRAVLEDVLGVLAS